ncbi:unnamed protein product [Phytophthora lilii]|uniref:Unnamed protein product n=1 Tax=Phytophthora lilii TaxID=2077276 RepID=A0A9W6TGQ5_9STRA|nr:unnamed protein product [Phytophthora lilii]
MCVAPSNPVWSSCVCVLCVCVLSSFDIMADWSSPGELFPGSLTVDSQELSMLLLEINSECPPFTRYEVAKRLKELCQYDSNRRALADLLKEQFVTGLQSMLKDDNEDIVRFAIYTILNFADDISTLNEYVYCGSLSPIACSGGLPFFFVLIARVAWNYLGCLKHFATS